MVIQDGYNVNLHLALYCQIQKTKYHSVGMIKMGILNMNKIKLQLSSTCRHLLYSINKHAHTK